MAARALLLHIKTDRRKVREPETASPARETNALPYVNAMHWRELTTSSGPFSAKKLS